MVVLKPEYDNNCAITNSALCACSFSNVGSSVCIGGWVLVEKKL
jgi:hypothetical protein